MTIHDFNESLDKSRKYAEAPWWEEVYSQAFPNLQAMHNVRGDGWAQRAGIDRHLILKDGTILKLDDKVRDKAYPDFCLEFYSDTGRKIRGWVAKDLNCDYIAYAFVPTEECFLLPFQLLRRAWKQHCHEWVDKGRRGVEGFRIVPAHNRGYVTTSVAVPRNILLGAMSEAMHTRWTSAQDLEQSLDQKAASG